MPRIIGRIAKHMFDSLTKCRLCRQVTGAVFLAILFVEGAILIFSVNNFERDRLIEIEREGLAVVRAWLEISSDDVEVLTRNAPRIGGGSVLLSATVYDKNHNELANLSQNSILAPDIDTFSVTWGEEKLGYPLVVHAKLDKTEIPAQIEKFVFGIVILVLLISFFVTVVTMLILERLLLIPIRRIRKRMNEACTDLSNPQDYLLENNKNDELGDVAKSYNDLLVRLSSAFSEIQIQQTNLERNNQKLEKEVNERTKELNSVVRDLRREAVERERAEKALDASNAHMSAEHLRKLAYTDTLTGLANRALFIDRCDQLLSQLKRADINAAVHLIDIDEFSKINQIYGAQAGDIVLQTVAERLSALVRDSDTLARLSADEFALIQFDIDSSDKASVLAQRITERLLEPIEYNDEKITVTCSIGITLTSREDASAEDILQHVGLARSRAKEDQGASYQFYVEEMNRLEMERMTIERDLRIAIQENQLELYFQPKLDVKTGVVSGMEALVRWNHPERGFMPPNSFIPIAERTSLIVDLGQWVLREACRHARSWLTKGYGDLKVAVNVSAVQLKESCMVTQVRQVLIETGLPAHLLELEITESAVMNDVERTITVLDELTALGLSLSIDDFGTGYSSLSYLKRFPVKRIKIDKAFIDEIEDLQSEGAIARAVIMMGHSLGMEITAEGVEEFFQLQYLSELGCDEIQGYYFGKPMNARDFEKFVKTKQLNHLAAE